jgi:hypothetical protein
MTVFELVAELRRLDFVFYLSGSEPVVLLKNTASAKLRKEVARLHDELVEYLRVTADPADDHWGDSFSWRQLFGFAYEEQGAGPDSVLHVLRHLSSRGARLEKNAVKKGWQIVPVVGKWGWGTMEDYQRFRQEHLMPRLFVIKELVKKLGD